MSFLKKYEGKIVVVVNPNCPACKALKAKVSMDEELRKSFVFLDATRNEDARLLAEGFNVMSVPTAFIVAEEDGKVKVCRLDGEMKKIEECMEVDYE
jgi:thioredoxin-related protein